MASSFGESGLTSRGVGLPGLPRPFGPFNLVWVGARAGQAHAPTKLSPMYINVTLPLVL